MMRPVLRELTELLTDMTRDLMAGFAFFLIAVAIMAASFIAAERQFASEDRANQEARSNPPQVHRLF